MKARLTGATLLLGMILLVLLTGCGNFSPVASFTYTPSSGQSPLTVSFNASSSHDSDGTIVTCQWTFGDGSNGTGVTPSHIYTTTSNHTYSVTLTVTDDGGAQATDSHLVSVTPPPPNSPPVASFTRTPSSGEAPLNVSFDASTSYDSDGSITSYVWDFGDGGSGSDVAASHTYNSAGIYTAQLTVTDDDGATDSIAQTIQVSAPPPDPTPHTANCQTGTAYLASDGLTVVLHSCVVVEKSSSYEYSIVYTLTNNTTDQAIDEGSFKMYYKNETGGLPQYGFFGKLFPGDTIDRTYTFEELKDKLLDLLEYAHDNFFSLSPLENSLRWSVEIP